MATKVFISWSGDLSKKLGEVLRQWLPSVLQFVKPYFSPDDIEKGTRWNNDVSKELENSNIGIICLTKDNTANPWILFESGALSKNFDKTHVCTILFNLEPAELKGPLTAFQATRFNKEDFKKLLECINNSESDSKLDQEIINEVFDMWWPKLEKQIKDILDSDKDSSKPTKRTERDMLEEILDLTRVSAKRHTIRPRTNSLAIQFLIDKSFELIYLLNRQYGIKDEKIMKYVEEIRPIVMEITDESGNTELWERFRSFERRIIMGR